MIKEPTQQVTPEANEQKPVKNQNKSRKKLVVILIVIVLLLLIISSLIRLRKQSTQVALQYNTFYSAMYNGAPVLFYKYPGMLYELAPIGTFQGEYIPYASAMSPMMMNMMMNVMYVDFRKLQNPRPLFTFERYATIENIKLSPDSSYLVMSMAGGQDDNMNYLYQVNLKAYSGIEIWQHQLRTGESPLNQGFAFVTDFVPGKYVAFDIIQGNPPPDVMPQGTAVLNEQTGAIVSLPPSGNIQFNASDFSYRQISKVKVPCVVNDPECFKGDTYKYNYLPTGQILTHPLP